MRLSDIQHNFKDTMLDAETLKDEPDFAALFKQDKGISLENRMKVYRNNVIRGLTDTAMAALPMTKKLVGKAFLEQTVRAYVTENLPEEGCINLYGREFPEFLKFHKPAQEIPYLADFTALEWAWECAYYAADDEMLDPGALADISEEDLPDLTFSFRASVALIASDHPLDEIVDFCRAEDNDGQELHNLGNDSVKLLVFRPQLKVTIQKLSDEEYEFLALLKKGKTIHEAAVTLEEDHPNLNLTEHLQKFLGLGIFEGYEVKNSQE